MGFGDIFKNTGILGGSSGGLGSLAPGSPEFKRLMGIAAAGNERNAARDDEDEIILVSKAEFKRRTGSDIRRLLEGFDDAAAAKDSPAAAAAPTGGSAAPPAAPAAGGVVVINPLLDLDLVPVRPGDLITAASFNALIAACASLHVRLSILEARGTATPAPIPAPVPGTGTGTPPVKRLPPDLKLAYVVSNQRSASQLTTIFANGLRLDGITDARLIYQDAAGKQIGSTSLPRRRTTDTTAIFSVGKTPPNLQRASGIVLEVTSADGKDRITVERPTTAQRETLEARLREVDDPLDLIDSIGKDMVKIDSIGNIR